MQTAEAIGVIQPGGVNDMIVLLDLEWIEKDGPHLTQLSAVRTDEIWNIQKSMNLLVNPGEKCLAEPEHIAFGGLRIGLFESGISEKDAVLTFQNWIRPADIIWVWANSNREYLQALWNQYCPDHVLPPMYSLAKDIRKTYLQKDRKDVSPHVLLARMNENPVCPEHRSSNDVEVMRRLFSLLEITERFLVKTEPQKEPQELIKAKIITSETKEIKRGNILGWCHNRIHRGALTKPLLIKHDCLGKQCSFLERNPDSPYWAAREAEIMGKEKRKAEQKAEKSRLIFEDKQVKR